MRNSIVIVSPHFRRKEFACKCGCGFEAVDVEVLTLIEELRVYFGRKVIIHSGCRCGPWNERVGGAKKSFHTKGMAADIRVEHIPATLVQNYFDEQYPDKYGLGSYPDFTHIDVRRDMARWSGK